MHFFQIPDRLLKLGCRVMRDRYVQDLARDVSDAVAMRISMGYDHPMTNGISYAANPFQILGYRAAFQAILQPAPPEQKNVRRGPWPAKSGTANKTPSSRIPRWTMSGFGPATNVRYWRISGLRHRPPILTHRGP